jgi:hypothetical protein
MPSIFDPSVCGALDRRLRSLSASTPRLWGKMTAHQMVCHVGDQVRCALGDIHAKPRKNVLSNAALRFIFVHLLPWPKGKLPTVPEMQSTRPGEWDADLAATAELIRRASARGADADWAVHPVFGPLSGGEWGRLISKHTDHHLRQFGV